MSVTGGLGAPSEDGSALSAAPSGSVASGGENALAAPLVPSEDGSALSAAPSGSVASGGENASAAPLASVATPLGSGDSHDYLSPKQ